MKYFSKRWIVASALSGLIVSAAHSSALAEINEPQTAVAAAPTVDCSQSPDLGGVWEVSEFKLTADEVKKTYKIVLDRYGNGTYQSEKGEIRTQGLSSQDWHANWWRPDIDQEGGFAVRFSDNYEEAYGSWWPTRIGKNSYKSKWVLYRYKWKRLTHARPGAASPRFADATKLKTKEQVEADVNAIAAGLNDRGAAQLPSPAVAADKTPAAAPKTRPLAGCPNLFEAELADVSDPFLPVNKFIFDKEQYVGNHSVNPVIRGISIVTPDFIKTGFTNLFDHYKLIMSVPNSLLQLRFSKTAHEFGRLVINSPTAGIYDLAANLPGKLKLAKLRAEDFGLTLGHWIHAAGGGYWEGPMLFPFRFQHTRDLIGTIVESNINPINKMVIGAVEGIVNPQGFVVQYLTDNAPFVVLGMMGNDSENQKKAFLDGAATYRQRRDAYLIMNRTKLMPEVN